MSTCISSLEVEIISSTKATISWMSECSRNSFIVMWSHLKFVSCDEQEMLRASNNRTVIGRTRTELGQLLPYSVYNISVSSTGDQGHGVSVMTVTEESIPQVCPTPVTDFSRDNCSSLTFRWTLPNISQCSLYRSRLGYLFYKLLGEDNTNNHEDMKEDNISIADTEITITGLKADTEYEFYLFFTNTMGEFDEDMFMKIEKKTCSSNTTSVFLIMATATAMVMLAVPMMTCLLVAVFRLTRRQHTIYQFTSLGETERDI